MEEKDNARSIVRRYFESLGKTPLPDSLPALEKLATMPPGEFKAVPFPASTVLDGCYFMGCPQCEFVSTTNPGLPLELFSEYCHSFVVTVTSGSRETIEQGHNTIRNYTLVQKRDILPSELCRHLPPNAGIEDDFYTVWTIYRRNDGVSPDFGPKFLSVLMMNGDVLGNYGVLFATGRHKPMGITVPSFSLSWASETFRRCDHRPPTLEVLSNQFIPQVKRLLTLCFGGAYKPEFLLAQAPFPTRTGDVYALDELSMQLSSYFPKRCLEFPASICRRGAKGNYALYGN